MIDQRMEALAATQHGLVTRPQAIALGLTPKAIQHGRRAGCWHLAARGVYRLAGAIDSPHQRALIAVFIGGEGAVLSHASAASLHALPGFPLEPLIVSVARNRRRARADLRVEQSLALPEHHVTAVDGIPCTTVARTLFDLCGEAHARRAERAMDTALSRKLVTRPALCRVLDDLAERGRAGTVLFRTLLDERADKYVAPESELEARFVQLVRRYGLAEPERQVDLGDDDGWIGRVDFLFRGARIIVEVDGAEFHDGLIDRRHDAKRDSRLEASGWFVVRFRWDDIVDRPASVAQSIRFRCALEPSQGYQVAPERFWDGVRG